MEGEEIKTGGCPGLGLGCGNKGPDVNGHEFSSKADGNVLKLDCRGKPLA